MLQDVSHYEGASEKKGALDEAFTKCLEFYERYISEVPCTEDYQAQREEAEAKFANLQCKKFTSEQKYEQFVQLCTDKEGSASDMCSVASKRSSASSIARRHDMIALQWKQKELSLELERADAEFRRRRCEVEMVQSRAFAQMELLKLKEAVNVG